MNSCRTRSYGLPVTSRHSPWKCIHTQSPGPFGGPEDAGNLVAGAVLYFDSAFFAIVTLPRHAILLARSVLTGLDWGRNS